MQITRMFEQGQSIFATTKVQDWLKERNHNPADYEIIFHQNLLLLAQRSDGCS